MSSIRLPEESNWIGLTRSGRGLAGRFIKFVVNGVEVNFSHVDLYFGVPINELNKDNVPRAYNSRLRININQVVGDSRDLEKKYETRRIHYGVIDSLPSKIVAWATKPGNPRRAAELRAITCERLRN